MNQKLLREFNRVEKTHWWWAGRRQLLKQLLSVIPTSPHVIPSAVEESLKILDIGCGTGETLSFLRRLYPSAQLHGVDSSPLAVKFAQSRGHRHIKLANALTLPFADNTFDTVLLLDVIEHISSDTRVLAEARRVLKPGGRIIITAPALSFIWSAHDANQGHRRRYTRRRVRSLARRLGLKISFLSYFNFFLSPPIILIRLLSHFKPLSFLAAYDSGFNYDIAQKNRLNSLLARLFIGEIKLLRFWSYPWGISLATVLTCLPAGRTKTPGPKSPRRSRYNDST